VILAIDPGPTESALVVYIPGTRKVKQAGKVRNEHLVKHIGMWSHDAANTTCVLVVEMIASYGMPVGAEVFETCVWIGRFLQAWTGPSETLYRTAIKHHICGSTRAKDGNVRQALIDAFGGKEKAIGKKASPGPLYAIKGDMWSALAVAVTYADRIEQAKAA
jgi:hypothetical protein